MPQEATAATIEFYTKVSDYTLVTVAVLPLLSLLIYLFIEHALPFLVDLYKQLVRGCRPKVSPEEQRMRDQQETEAIKAGALAESSIDRGDERKHLQQPQSMTSMAEFSAAATVALVSLNYLTSILWPVLVLLAGCVFAPAVTIAALVVATVSWVTYISLDGAEYRTGKPDKRFTQQYWVFRRLREYLSLKLHRTTECQAALLRQKPTGQAIFACFPHGVNSDFRVLMDGEMHDAFSKVYEKAPVRTLVPSILFRIPGVRGLSLATACVDSGRKTATKCLQSGFSLMLCPGGQDEQLETIYGRERVYLKKRAGFVRLAIMHDVPVVPSFCFGSSDLYYTSRLAHKLRVWLVRNLRIALPLYSGGCAHASTHLPGRASAPPRGARSTDRPRRVFRSQLGHVRVPDAQGLPAAGAADHCLRRATALPAHPGADKGAGGRRARAVHRGAHRALRQAQGRVWLRGPHARGAVTDRDWRVCCTWMAAGPWVWTHTWVLGDMRTCYGVRRAGGRLPRT